MMPGPTTEFWAVVNDVCAQAAREHAEYPYRKYVEIQLTVPEVEVLRLGYVTYGGMGEPT
jgi:hypothetical protein